MAFRKLVGSYKDYNLSTHVIEEGYLAVDVDTGSLRIGDGSTPGGTAVAGVGAGGITATVSGDTLTIDGSGVTTILDEDNLSSDSATALATQQSIKAYVDNEIAGVGGGGSTGDVTFVGATISAPSNAPLTLTSSGSSVDIEGLSIAGTNISTTDSSAGVEITGNLIPSQNGVFTLGSSTRRWQTAFLAAETIDLGGATISSDGTGTINIAATGATLPVGSKVQDNPIALNGAKSKTLLRPVQNVKVYVSDGSTNFTDAQFLARSADLELEFNATVETVPVYTEADQTFTLSNGNTLQSNASGITLFQF